MPTTIHLTEHSYDRSYKKQMDAFPKGLWSQLELIPMLEPDVRKDIIQYLLELACQCQNMRNITLGRESLWSLPREWLIQHIESYAEPLLQLEDEWEYRRLAEVYEGLDGDLLRRLIARGLESRNPDIREAAADYSS